MQRFRTRNELRFAGLGFSQMRGWLLEVLIVRATHAQVTEVASTRCRVKLRACSMTSSVSAVVIMGFRISEPPEPSTLDSVKFFPRPLEGSRK